jgi:lipocalin
MFSKVGKHKKAIRVAWIPDPATMGQLKVRFFWPFTGDYHIVALDQKNYRYAMIKSGGLLWILAREPKLDDEIYNSLVAKAVSLGIDTEKLIKVEQEW